MNGAIHDDLVIVEITSKKGIDLEGRILKVVKRELKNLVATVSIKNNKLSVFVENNPVSLS